MTKKAIIIGSGFGGLSLACRLQSDGFDVEIFEKNAMVGGHAYQLKKDGYTFDMGPSLITAPDIIQKIFEKAGKNLNDYVEMIPLDPFYRIYFADKAFFDYSGDSEKMKNEIAKFSKEDADRYDDFIEYTKKLYEEIIVGGVGAKPFYMKDFLEFAPKAIQLNAFMPVTSQVNKFFKHPKIQFAFSFHPLFVGGNPFNTPSVYLMIPYLEKIGKVWFTKGGMYSLVEALEKLFKEQGGKVHLNSEVIQILTENKHVNGVKLKNNEIHKADLVVSNAHYAHTYMDLISESERPGLANSNIENKDYSMSCFLIYLGTKKRYPELLHHTLILSERYKGLIDDIFKHKVLADDQSIYLHAPTRTDDSMAPQGCESMYMLIPVPNLKKRDTSWSEIKNEFTNRILNFLENDFGLKDLKTNIEVCEVFTPEDFEKIRNNYLGACWSLEPYLLQSASFRPHNKSEYFDNLYLVGASTHPGAGVPGVMLSAEATEKAILEDFKLNN